MGFTDLPRLRNPFGRILLEKDKKKEKTSLESVQGIENVYSLGDQKGERCKLNNEALVQPQILE